MKRILIALCLVALAVSSAPAQEDEMTPEQLDELTQILRANLRAEKTKWVEANVQLTADQKDNFWALYRRYEADRTTIGNEWLANIKDYAEHYDSMTEEKAKELLDKAFDVEKKLLAVEEKHKNEMMKHLPATVVGRFFQIDRRLNLLMDVEAASQIPLVKAN